jgi:ligand-binding sensor domain-containing protein
LWVGTSHGLNRINIEDSTVESFFNKVNDPMSISDNVIDALLVDQKGHIWVGTQMNGICKIMLKDKNTIAHLLHYKDDFLLTKV